MNRIYSLVWNRALDRIVVASELASNKIAKVMHASGCSPRRAALGLALLAALALPLPGLAGETCLGPTGSSPSTAAAAFA